MEGENKPKNDSKSPQRTSNKRSIGIKRAKEVVSTMMKASTFLFFLVIQSAMGQNHVPDWAKGMVWYQIFPERFANGDDSNNPTADRIRAPKGWEVSSWTSDWYQREDWFQRYSVTFKDGVTMRRYGGDLQGVIDRLDYLSDLGIEGIYFNPLFDARTMHKYDATMYHHIDRFFGPDPEGDALLMASEDPADRSTWKWTSADLLFLELIKEAHQRNIRIIIDGVFNHTGPEFWAFQDILQHQEQSTYKDWYSIISWDDPATEKNEFDYHGWWGYKGLPEFKEVEGNLQEGIKAHIFDITRRWMDPNGDGNPSDGIDGWRLDVTEEVGFPFWEEWHTVVRSINAEAFTTAEVWSLEAKNYVEPGLFSSAMNYPWLRAVHSFFITQQLSPSQFDSTLAEIRTVYSDEEGHALQNLMDSHDTERLASMVVNSDHMFKEKSKLEAPTDTFEVRKPTLKERELQKLILGFQLFYQGSPMIYYGTEAGMWGADDPDDRKPMIWPELIYKDEMNHPFSHWRPKDTVAFDSMMFEWVQRCISIRKKNSSLKKGKIQTLPSLSKSSEVFGFKRWDKTQELTLIFNRSEQPQVVESNFFEQQHWRELLGNTTIDVQSADEIWIPGLSVWVLTKDFVEK